MADALEESGFTLESFVNNTHDRPRLPENLGNWILLKLEEPKSNRNDLGTCMTVQSDDRANNHRCLRQSQRKNPRRHRHYGKVNLPDSAAVACSQRHKTLDFAHSVLLYDSIKKSALHVWIYVTRAFRVMGSSREELGLIHPLR